MSQKEWKEFARLSGKWAMGIATRREIMRYLELSDKARNA